MKTKVWLFLALACALTAVGGCGGGGDSGSGKNSGPTPNPWLAASLYGTTHFDPAQSDSTPYGPPRGTFTVDPTKQPISYGGPVNIITLASTSPSFMWGVGSDRVAYIDAADGKWVEVARIDAPAYLNPGMGPVAPGAHKAIGEMSFEGKTSGDVHQIFLENYGANYNARLANGVYSAVDRDNVLYATYGYGVYAFALKDSANMFFSRH